MLKRVFVDKAFLGAGGISRRAGVTDYHFAEAELRRIIMANARFNYLLADSSKQGVVAVSKYADLADIDYYLSDNLVNKPLKQALEEAQVQVLLAASWR